MKSETEGEPTMIKKIILLLIICMVTTNAYAGEYYFKETESGLCYKRMCSWDCYDTVVPCENVEHLITRYRKTPSTRFTEDPKGRTKRYYVRLAREQVDEGIRILNQSGFYRQTDTNKVYPQFVRKCDNALIVIKSISSLGSVMLYKNKDDWFPEYEKHFEIDPDGLWYSRRYHNVVTLIEQAIRDAGKCHLK